MTGWKTKFGGAVLILSALSMMLNVMSGEGGSINEAWTMLNEGLALLGVSFLGVGIGHKVEKAADKVAVGNTPPLQQANVPQVPDTR